MVSKGTTRSSIITKAETIHGSQLTEINHVRQQVHTCSQLGSIYEQSHLLNLEEYNI